MYLDQFTVSCYNLLAIGKYQEFTKMEVSYGRT